MTFHGLLSRTCISWCLGGTFYRYVLCIWCISVVFLVHFLSRWPIYWRNWVLNTPSFKGLMFICVFNSSSKVLIKLGTSEFGVYMSNIVMPSWLIVPLNRMKCHSWSFWFILLWSLILSDSRMSLPIFFLFIFDWGTLSVFSLQDGAYV